MSVTPTPEQQALRERIKLAIQTAQDSEGRLLYVIPPGVAGMYADAVMRVLTLEPYPDSSREDARRITDGRALGFIQPDDPSSDGSGS